MGVSRINDTHMPNIRAPGKEHPYDPNQSA